MRFTKKQLEFLRGRFSENKRIMSFKPSEGYLGLMIQNQTIRLLMDIHNAGTDHES